MRRMDSDQVVVLNIRCAGLIKGIIEMHQFAYGCLTFDSFATKELVLRFIGVNVGMVAPTDEEAERLEMMSYNSGAAFSPNDAFNFLNLLYSAFRDIVSIDCSYDTLTVVGTWDYEAKLTGSDLQQVADSDFPPDYTDRRYIPSYR